MAGLFETVGISLRRFVVAVSALRFVSAAWTDIMKIFYTLQHSLHAPKQELHRGGFGTPHEAPYRMDLLIAGLERAGFSARIEPGVPDRSVIAAIHTEPYLNFLQTAWDRWQAAGYEGDVIAMSFPRGARRPHPPTEIDGAVGYFCAASDTVITASTWHAVLAGVDCALSAAEHVAATGEVAFSLSRPPGHHAGADYMSGYCFVNVAALAAEHLRKGGADRVAILDVDFHHGNGTQDIFYQRNDVLFASIHGAPEEHFPYFWGHRDETGANAGEGFTRNYPLATGSDFRVWNAALTDALAHITRFAADALVVSLGVDTYAQDPLSGFRLAKEDFLAYGRRVGALGLPSVFIMEGGYGVPEIGDNVSAVLSGFLDPVP